MYRALIVGAHRAGASAAGRLGRVGGIRLRLGILLAWATVVLAPALVADAEAYPSHARTARPVQATRYRELLLDEINFRREWVGIPELALAPESANEALDHYLADLAPPLLAAGTCDHGVGSPPRYGWDYVAETGFGSVGHGEVIGCPDTTSAWTPDQIAESWWASTVHHDILYADPGARFVACGTYGPRRDGAAYQTVTCVTYAES